eukprot:1161750-Pelagomonas_calceolata.AAC.6
MLWLAVQCSKFFAHTLQIRLACLRADTNPFPTLKAATAQHAKKQNQAQNPQLKKPTHRDTKVTLHIVSIGEVGTICNDCTIKPLIDLVLTRQKAKSLAFKLSCHAIQRLTSIIHTRHVLQFQVASGGVLGARRWRAGEGESGRPGAWLAIPDPY